MSRDVKKDSKGRESYEVNGVKMTNNWGSVELPATTKCKHDKYQCETCGTSDRNDKIHTTVGGKGLVARLREKK